jgi:hypothetical protein
VELRLDQDVLQRLDAAGHHADDWATRAPTPTG